MKDLTHWTPRPLPKRAPLAGRYVRLEPLDPEKHGKGLFAASSVRDAAARFSWLREEPPSSPTDFDPWLQSAAERNDPLFFVVVDVETDQIGGRQALMRMDPENGVVEIGSIYWGPQIARTRLATEAFYLFARHIFDDLGYRRFEWKCDSENKASRRAALRFGFRFEGIFRQHMVMKGKNRDTAWFAMLDHEWPSIRRAIELWLDPVNFDIHGKQIKNLGSFIEDLRGQQAEK